MAFTLTPALPFIPTISVVPSTVLNAWRDFFPACLDADQGGTYTNTAPIIFDTGSAGWEFRGPITAGPGISYGLSSRSKTRVLGLHVKALGATQLLGWEVDDNWGDLAQTSTSAVQNLIFELDDIPDGAVLNEVALWVLGGSGHSTVITTVDLPEITLRIAPKNAGATTGGSASDPSLLPADYEVRHDIRIDGLSLAIDRSTTRYALSMTPESGVDSVVGLAIIAVEIVYTITALPE